MKINIWKHIEILGWLLIESSIGVAVTYFSGLDMAWCPIAVSLLVMLGKELNKRAKGMYRPDRKDSKS